MIKLFTRYIFLCLFSSLLFLPSCYKFENGQTVPSYIRIDSVNLECDYFTYGANTRNISDVWVYVDDQIVGCFELPSTFPVLKKDFHKVSVYPGIKVDGKSSARAPYPFMKPCIWQDLRLVEDSIISLYPVFNYYDVPDVNLRWREDFEQGAISLNATPQSDTNIIRVSGSEAMNIPLYSSFSGKIQLPPDSLHFTVASFEEMTDLPSDNTPCMLELDYNCNADFTVGVLVCDNFTIIEKPLVTVQATDSVNLVPNKWKKIYINIGPTIRDNRNADYYKIFFTSRVYKTISNDGTTPVAPIDADHVRYYYFDNIKLICR